MDVRKRILSLVSGLAIVAGMLLAVVSFNRYSGTAAPSAGRSVARSLAAGTFGLTDTVTVSSVEGDPDVTDSLNILGLTDQNEFGIMEDSTNDDEALFEIFKTRYNRTYTGLEHDKRFNTFRRNVDFIRSYNSRSNESELALNQYADLTDEEFAIYKFGSTDAELINMNETDSIEVEDFSDVEIQAVPTSVDWRTKNVLAPVENQGACGSCWSFTTAGAVEALYAIERGTRVRLSRQHLVDCAVASGCVGGSGPAGFSYMTSKGVRLLSQYPYTARDGSCRYSGGPYRVTGYRKVPSGNQVAMKAVVARQPVYAAICSSSSVYRFYKSGVIRSGCCTSLNHANLVVGYGTLNGIPYWLLKNQWGTGYGDGGYVRIARSNTATSGSSVCGVASLVTYPYGTRAV